MAVLIEGKHESLVQTILGQILIDNRINNIKVAPNIHLNGKSGATHRIDIYWEFQFDGNKYTTIVEVKVSSKPIGQETIFQFASILDDLIDQPIGIFVSNAGYQTEARTLAKNKGILLYELQESNIETHLDDRIKSFKINISEYTPVFSNIKIIQDIEWNLHEMNRLNIPTSEASRYKIEVSDNLKFYDENDQQITIALKLFNSLVPKGFDELPPTKITYTFEKPTFIKALYIPLNTTVKEPIPPLKSKINGIEFTVEKKLRIIEILLKGENFVQYILDNLTNIMDHVRSKMHAREDVR